MAGSGFAPTSHFQLSKVTSTSGPGIEVTVVTKTADFRLGTATDIVLADASAASLTISLPGAVTASGKLFWIKKIDESANTVTVDPDGTECIDNELSILLCNEGDTVQIVSNGSQWYII